MFYLDYYDIETYLFSTVHGRFRRDGYLCAFDFFSIVRWKSNRSRGRILDGLREKWHPDTEEAVRRLTREIHLADDHENRLRTLIGPCVPGVGLAIATAILTVLYPDDFTVYDTRVCKQLEDRELGRFSNLGNRSEKGVWRGYEDYLKAVRQAAPKNLRLRDMDRWLWTQDVVDDLINVGCALDRTVMCDEYFGAEQQQV